MARQVRPGPVLTLQNSSRRKDSTLIACFVFPFVSSVLCESALKLLHGVHAHYIGGEHIINTDKSRNRASGNSKENKSNVFNLF